MSTTSTPAATGPAATGPAATGPAATTRTVLRAEGFGCPSCVTTIERRLGRLDGVAAVTVRFASARVEVVHDPRRVSVDDLAAAVTRLGYPARPA